MPLVFRMETTPLLRETGQNMHQYGILMHMRTTMILNEALVEEARRLTGLTEKTALVHAGLEALIAREVANRLADLGGSDPAMTAGRRRRVAARRGR
jgi:Arc/MetJ family transcription regulator